MRIHKVCSLLIVLVSGGCTTHYRCPNLPDHQCSSLSQIYAHTGADFVDDRYGAEAKGKKDTSVPSREQWQVPAPDQPLLVPERVVRIWLTPWEDHQGDLQTGYVFVHMRRQTWRINP